MLECDKPRIRVEPGTRHERGADAAATSYLCSSYLSDASSAVLSGSYRAVPAASRGVASSSGARADLTRRCLDFQRHLGA